MMRCRIRRYAILGGLLALGPTAAQAEPLVFFDFSEGTAGENVQTVPNRGSAGTTFDGTATVASGGTVTYSDDVPGILYADHAATTPLSPDWKSIAFTVDGDNGAIVSVPALGTHLCRLGTNGNFTVEFFAKAAVQQNWKDLVKFYFKDASYGNREAKYVMWNKGFGLQNSASNPSTVGAETNVWYHLAAVYTVADGTWRMYCNGTLYAVQANRILGPGWTAPLTLGGQTASYETYAGKLAGLRITPEALAPAQFMKVANGTPPASADTLAFYLFDEGEPGTEVSKVSNAMDALAHSGMASQVDGGAMPVYSDDVPGYWLYSDVSCTNLLSSGANSVKFAPAEGNNASGGLLTLGLLATAMSALDEGTVEFFAESDANLSWRNMITFDAGQRFKVAYHASSFQYQNFWVYNAPDSCLSVSLDAASGRWYHAAVTWSKRDNRARCYADYVSKGSVYLTNVTTSASRPLYVGGSGAGSESFCGKVFGLRVCSRILTTDEMLRATKFPMHGDGVLVSSDGADSTTASTIVIEAGRKLKIRSGAALTAERVTAAGTVIAAGLYTGVAGVEGATVVDWIDGAGTLTVTGTSEISVWMTPGNGTWSTAANWSDALLPRTGHPASVDMPMPSSYAVTVDREVVTPSSLLIACSSVATATVDVVAGGAMAFADAAIQVNRGGVLQVAGGTVAATNASVTVAAGGTLRVASGRFSFDSARVHSFVLKSGALLDLTGGTAEIYNVAGSDNVFNMETGSRLRASGDAVLDLCGSRKCQNYLRGSEIALDDDARLKVSHVRFGAYGGTAQTVTFRDRASMSFVGDAILYLGWSDVAGTLEMNLDSSAETLVPYGVIVGSAAGATLNIRNGHYVRGSGNWNAVGDSFSGSPRGTVNVWNGAFVQKTSAQWSDCPYGITVGENKGNASSGAVGVLNVYPDGVVSNLTDNAGQAGKGVYLRVGSGRHGDGTINQYGGEVYHDSNLGCLIGAWGGTGRWNVCSGSVATVLCDVYVGGAPTNSLIAFGPSASPDAGRGNGGEAFGKKYDAFALSTGTLTVEDGTFATPSNLLVSALGTGTVRIGPAATARLSARNVTLGSTVDEKDADTVHNSTVVFRFTKESTGTIAVADRLAIAGGTKLVLDFTGYEGRGKVARFPLFTYAAREGDFAAADIRIVGEEPRGGRLVKDVTCAGGRSYQYVISRGGVLFLR